MRDSDAMPLRARRRSLTRVSAALSLAMAAVMLAAPLGAQSGGTAKRDTSARSFRLRVVGEGRDTAGVLQRIRASHEELRAILDSLTSEFDGLAADSPLRSRLDRQIEAMVRALAEVHRSAGPGTRAGGSGAVTAWVQAPEAMSRARRSAQPRGWIGINVEAPQTVEVRGDSMYVRYLTYPQVVSVEPGSPAASVGISHGDRLVAYNGSDLRSRAVNVTRLFQPENRVTVTVQRDGAERDFPVVVGRPPLRIIERMHTGSFPGLADSTRARVLVRTVPRPGEPGELGRVLMYSENAAVAGASLAEINSESLGRYFGVNAGVLVIRVFGDPAAASGLREGDVIVRADDRAISSVPQLRRLVAAHDDDRSVELRVVRHKKPLTLTLKW